MGYRTERDFLGERQIPDEAYYGIQTLRGKENFTITAMPISREPYFVKACLPLPASAATAAGWESTRAAASAASPK